MRLARIGKVTYEVRLRVPNADNAFEQIPESSLLVLISFCLQLIKTNRWDAIICGESTIHEIVAIEGQASFLTDDVYDMYQGIEDCLPEVPFLT